MAARQTGLPIPKVTAETPSGRRSPRGSATTELVLSAHVGTNADIFPDVLRLHVSLGAKIADVTYGKGVFWRKIDATSYDLHTSDIATGVDCRALPYDRGSFDAVVFDPPYMEGFFRNGQTTKAGAGTHAAFRDHYSHGQEAPRQGGGKWHAAVVDLYVDGGREAGNVADSTGAFDFIGECMDRLEAALPGVRLETRMDSAFFDGRLLAELELRGVEYSVSVPFARFADLKAMVEDCDGWRRAGPDLDCFEPPWKPAGWDRRRRVLVLRQRVAERRRTPLQLDLFEPREHSGSRSRTY